MVTLHWFRGGWSHIIDNVTKTFSRSTVVQGLVHRYARMNHCTTQWLTTWPGLYKVTGVLKAQALTKA